MDGGYDPFMGDQAKFDEMEASMAKARAKGDVKAKGLSARLSAIHEDQEAWETNRMLTAGAARQGRVDLEFDEETDNRTQLMVHNLRPPFLDGRVSFTTQMKIVQTVRGFAWRVAPRVPVSVVRACARVCTCGLCVGGACCQLPASHRTLLSVRR